MPRPRRFDHEGAWHHVTNRGISRASIFVDEHDRTAFLSLLAGALERFSVELHAYCLMGNHYHLLLRSRDGRLSELMQSFSSRYTFNANRRHGRDGPLFRGRFNSVLIESDAHLVQTLRYIHLNPTEAGLVERAEDWQWSSAALYLGVRPAGPTPGGLVRLELLAMFGSNSGNSYRDFMAAGIDDDTRRRFAVPE